MRLFSAAEKGDLFMKIKGTLLTLCCIFLLSLGFTVNADAAQVKFAKKSVVLNVGQSKTLTVKNTNGSLQILDSSAYNGCFTYQLVSSSKVKVTAKKPGISSIIVSSNGKTDYAWVSVMPGKNKQIKQKQTAAGTKITYKKVSLTLPKNWKTSNYLMLTTKNSISFHSKANYKVGYTGTVFTVNWCTAKKWKKEKINLPNYRYLGKKGKYVFYVTLPTDVQFCLGKPKYQKQYLSLYNTTESIIASIKCKK